MNDYDGQYKEKPKIAPEVLIQGKKRDCDSEGRGNPRGVGKVTSFPPVTMSFLFTSLIFPSQSLLLFVL